MLGRVGAGANRAAAELWIILRREITLSEFVI
jgi:hypothetical protein